MPLVLQVTLQPFYNGLLIFLDLSIPLQRNLEQDTLLQQPITLLVGPKLNQSRTVVLLQLQSSYSIASCLDLGVLEFS